MIMEHERTSEIITLISTSRNPSHFLRRVSKIFTLIIPNSEKLPRGSLNKKQIFNYCRNQNIKRLLILQVHDENSTIFVKAYSIEDTILHYNADIILSDIIRMQKHDKNTRIIVDNIDIIFCERTSDTIKKKVNAFFHPIIKNQKIFKGRKFLVINFKQEKPNYLSGFIHQRISSSSLAVCKVSISFKCGTDEE